MENRPGSFPQFPVHLSRRLSIVQAAILAAVLIAGGLALYSAAQIYRINTLANQEYDHALLIESVHIAFHEVLAAAQQIETMDGSAAARRLREAEENLDRQMQAVAARREDTKAATDDDREGPLIEELQRLTADVRTLTASFGLSPDGGTIHAYDLEPLETIAGQGAQVATKLVNVHQDGARQLLGMGQQHLRVIIALYFGLIAIGVTFVAFAGLFGNRWIAAPLRRLAAAAGLLAEGRLEARVPVQSRDEIGQLSHAFNAMADRLEDHERDLRGTQARLEQRVRQMAALHEIGGKILALDGPNVILRSIVDAACANLCLDAAVVCVPAPDTDALMVHSISGPDEVFRVRTGTVYRAADGCAGDRHDVAQCPVIRAEFARSHLAVPLKRGEESIGMLCVASRQERTLSAAEMEFLVSLAAQAAITLEHARLDAEVRRLAVIEERGRIARDMHDGLAQTVCLLHLRIRQVQAQVSQEASPSIHHALEEVASISGDMHDEIRRSIVGLRTAAAESVGLVPALAEFVQEFSVQNRFLVDFSSTDADADALSSAVESDVSRVADVIRIVQEALNNARKHAQTDRAHVRVNRQGSWVCVSVEDRGCGFDLTKMAAEDGLHFGLRGMQERADRCAGKLEIDSSPGRGTRVALRIPLEASS